MGMLILAGCYDTFFLLYFGITESTVLSVSIGIHVGTSVRGPSSFLSHSFFLPAESSICCKLLKAQTKRKSEKNTKTHYSFHWSQN